ncbi:flagellar biosynthesis protein [Aquincola sp. MAHUQ-54]|uniref:Flagellar biosynthesis protein n=1 Tax=Aquincola agrisoli TaxID=3119538 RepID=A0AAW9QG14_9BURK
MRDFYASRSAPLDQADGLRKLFNPTRTRYIAVASNPHVAFATVLIERLTTAIAASGRKLLLVDAAETAPEPHELALLDLAAGVEQLSPQIAYLAARGLPLRHVDTRGSCAGMLTALSDAAPQADVVLVHAGASELSRLFSHRVVRPILLAADFAPSVTHAYAAMKVLAGRNGLMAFDLMLAVGPQRLRRQHVARQISQCADSFLGAAVHDWIAVDPACDVAEAPEAALMRLVRQQLADDNTAPEAPVPAWHRHGTAAASLSAN